MANSPSLIGITTDALTACIEDAFGRAVAREPERLGRLPTTTQTSRKDWLTNREALDYLGVCKATLYRYRRDGKVPYSKVGSKLFYRKTDLDAFLDTHAHDQALTSGR